VLMPSDRRLEIPERSLNPTLVCTGFVLAFIPFLSVIGMCLSAWSLRSIPKGKTGYWLLALVGFVIGFLTSLFTVMILNVGRGFQHACPGICYGHR
jgi:hypothetical protein